MTQIMILGCYHMANPGLDVVNLEVADVCTPEKQAELAEVNRLLAAFQPNKIALEIVADRPNFITSIYQNFSPEKLLTEANEREQIGLRLAHHLEHSEVYGIDEQSETIDYFPFETVQNFAANNNQQHILEKSFAYLENLKTITEQQQKTATIRELLIAENTLEYGVEQMQNLYIPLLEIGNENTHPGAELNTMWYSRNAKIFAKLKQLAKPNDKILVLFGSGHNYWLRHFVQLTPAFELIEANTYLTRA